MTRTWLVLFVAASVFVRAGALVLIVPHHGAVIDQLCHFDCGWYERIALAGYGADSDWNNLGSAPHWAFFPLYPLLIRSLVAISGASAQQSGIAISLVASAVMACMIGGGIGRRRGGGAVAAAIFVLVFPIGIFFSLVYAEALYGALAMASLGALRRGRPMRAAIWASLAGATRPAGILLALIIAGKMLRELLRRRWTARALGDALLPVAIAPLGLSVFVLAQYMSVGDGFAFAHVQILWGRSWSDPMTRIFHGLAANDLGHLFGAPSLVWHALWAVCGLLVGGWLLVRRRGAEGVFLVGSVLLPAATGLDAMPRFVGTNPVFLASLAERVVCLPRWLMVLVLLACAATQLVLLRVWAMGGGGVF